MSLFSAVPVRRKRIALREGESEQAGRLREDLRELGIAVKDKGEEQNIRFMQTDNSHFSSL